MTFEEWLRRPVYLVHCETTEYAKQLCGLDPRVNLALSKDSPHALATFRARPEYRTPQALALRKRVALHFRKKHRAALRRCPKCPHDKGFNCRVCWPRQYREMK